MPTETVKFDPSQVVYGMPARYVILIVAGKHQVRGGGGNDVICAPAEGGSVLDGGDGDDVLIGGPGAQQLSGGAGNDTLIGGTGADQLTGGAGTDTVDYSDRTTSVIADLDGSANDGAPGEGDRISTDVENLTGGAGNDTLTGNDAPNKIIGGAGDDDVSGGAADDDISGGAGNDKLVGDARRDRISGDAGTNLCDSDFTDEPAAYCIYDSTAPVVSGVEMTSPVVDITSGQSVRLRMKVTDDLSGVDTVFATIAGPNGMQVSPSLHRNARAATTSRNARDVVIEATVPLPATAASGAWSINEVRVVDRAWNRASYTKQTAAPRPGDAVRTYPAAPATFEVRGAEVDKIAPVLSNIKVLTPVVDASKLGASVIVEFNARDEGSGLDYIRADAQTYDPARRIYVTKTGGSLNIERLDGTNVTGLANGRYRATFVLPPTMTAGTSALEFRAVDRQRDLRYFTAPFTVSAGAADVTAPVLLSSTTMTPLIDKSKSLKAEFRLTLQEEASEARVVVADIVGPNGQSRSVHATAVGPATGISTWRVAFDLPAEAAAGVWRVNAVRARDLAGNTMAATAEVRSIVGGQSVTTPLEALRGATLTVL
ncbi:calcium-binding protein [Kineococcus auxinigenes]|uniref:hypothetical protein n=1 Tax=unclassified Kineococcus TaxID=2621656 RepID=UPI003D7D7615